MQKRVLVVYFSIMRRRAICAVEVMASASSRIINLNLVREALEEGSGVAVKICFVPGVYGEHAPWKFEFGVKSTYLQRS